MRATPESTAIPVELQEQILSHLSTTDLYDLFHLWTSVRNVSTTFRSIVDDLVRKKQLKYTHIDYFIDWASETRLDFCFHHILPENPNIAVFKADVDHDDRRCIENALEGAGIKRQNTDQDIYRPRHLIYVRRYANDCELQDYSFDLDASELRCNWKGLFTAFCYEEKLVDKLEDGYVAEPLPADATGEAMINSFKEWSKYHDDCRKKARRSRIARQCARQGEEVDEMFLGFFEEGALERLDNADREGNYVEFSDEE